MAEDTAMQAHDAGAPKHNLKTFMKTPKGKVAIAGGFAILIGLYLYMHKKSAPAPAAPGATTSLTPSTVAGGGYAGGYGGPSSANDSNLSAIAQALSGLQAQIPTMNANGTAGVPTASSGDTTTGANSSVSNTNSTGAGSAAVPQTFPLTVTAASSPYNGQQPSAIDPNTGNTYQQDAQ